MSSPRTEANYPALAAVGGSWDTAGRQVLEQNGQCRGQLVTLPQPPGGLLCPGVPQCPFPCGVGLGLSEVGFVPKHHGLSFPGSVSLSLRGGGAPQAASICQSDSAWKRIWADSWIIHLLRFYFDKFQTYREVIRTAQQAPVSPLTAT